MQVNTQNAVIPINIIPLSLGIMPLLIRGSQEKMGLKTN
jgi:hypothetical protein